jgi:hypothetical protein
MALVRRPRVPRETRLLFTAALLAVVALWALARLRFPDSAPTGQIVPPILAPFVARQGFFALETQLAEVSNRTAPSLEAIAIGDSERVASPVGTRHVPALRLHDDVAVVLLGQAEGEAAVIGRDAATGLAVLRLTPGPAAPIAQAWPRCNDFADSSRCPRPHCAR